MEILEKRPKQTGTTETDIIREHMFEFGDSSPTPSPIGIEIKYPWWGGTPHRPKIHLIASRSG